MVEWWWWWWCGVDGGGVVVGGWRWEREREIDVVVLDSGCGRGGVVWWFMMVAYGGDGGCLLHRERE
ncbi:hypothetical protein HanIR_Chr09g0448721 [Helianthus annuus]|nr:hypothetical protein HanIR_Chr09g0448721 [Helianthus annuus]